MTFELASWTPEVQRSLPKPKAHCGYLTGVGSREAPEEHLALLKIVAAIGYSLGYIWRSGGAKGADSAIEDGVLQHPYYEPVWDDGTPSFEIYLPKPQFNQRPTDPDLGYYNAKALPAYAEAIALACEIHPLGERLRKEEKYDWALACHARNIFQVLGKRLEEPSQRVFCSAPVVGLGLVTGGTRTAVALATQYGIPVLNLADPVSKTKVLEFIDRQLKRLCPVTYRST